MNEHRFNNLLKGGRKERWLLLLKLYEPTKSASENIKELKEKGIYISRKALTDFLKYYNIDPKLYIKIKRQKVLELYDKEKTYIENLKNINEHGIKICMGSLYNLINRNKK